MHGRNRPPQAPPANRESQAEKLQKCPRARKLVALPLALLVLVVTQSAQAAGAVALNSDSASISVRVDGGANQLDASAFDQDFLDFNKSLSKTSNGTNGLDGTASATQSQATTLFGSPTDITGFDTQSSATVTATGTNSGGNPPTGEAHGDAAFDLSSGAQFGFELTGSLSAGSSGAGGQGCVTLTSQGQTFQVSVKNFPNPGGCPATTATTDLPISQFGTTQDLGVVLDSVGADNSAGGANTSWDLHLDIHPPCTINVAQPNQTTNGTPGDDVICGTEGDDTINGLGGNDTLVGRGGADTITGGNGIDRILGGTGNDPFLYGGYGDDTIDAGPGNDGAIGGFGVAGGGGDDTITGGPGDDILFGRCAEKSPDNICPGDPPLPGESDRDTIDGGAGQDDILGDAGKDTIEGGADNDFILGGAGADQIDGGPGNELLGAGAGSKPGITGGAGPDTILGGAGDDFIDGGAGNDNIFGDDGSDKLRGGANGDCMVGGPRKDVLAGGAGDDKLKSVDGVHDKVHGNGGAHDKARVDSHDSVDGVENLSPPPFDCAPSG